jgi:hypothetical protein
VALKAKQRANPEEYRRRQRVSRLRTTYGVSVEQFEQMEAAQGGVCAICSKPNKNGWKLAVDHCHSTGVIRGLLCSSCNLAIGALGDTSEMLERAIAYLRGIRA